VHGARQTGKVPANVQDPAFATRAPMIRKAVVLPGETAPTNTSLVVSIVGTDRPGIVNALAERAQRFGANWAASRMTRLAGEFAGMVHFEVPRENAQALTTSLQGLASSGLQVVIAASDGAALPASLRLVELELVGEDQVGIVSKLTQVLAERAISIESIHTDIVSSVPGQKTFKVKAQLRVPATLSVEALQRDVGALASDMMLDIALGESQDSGL
jgi:glycine cleavage system regulatory protein